jgi:Tol biopolymer transport system component
MRQKHMQLAALVAVIVCASISGACQQTPHSLPLPQSVDQAVLVNLRPLTRSGWAGDPAWSPDGKALVYTRVSSPTSQYATQPPEPEIWWIGADGSGAHVLAPGQSPLFSRDGATVYYTLCQPHAALCSLWGVDQAKGQSRQLLQGESQLVIHQLADSRLVVSDSGTYAPLRVLDPATGELHPLMPQHPSNFPEDARLAPDGSLLAYVKFQDVYLSQPDGSNGKLLSQNGGFSARVWWSPDSQYLAYTSGNHWTDRFLLARRTGETVAVLFPRLEESGYISAVAWSPDSRWLLVATEPYEEASRPTRLYLFDTTGANELLLESYLAGLSWSPNGQTLALVRWSGLLTDQRWYDIWLADLTDQATAANLPAATPPPTLTPMPTLSRPPADLAPDAVVHRFWDAITAGDYRTAWATQANADPTWRGWPEFKDIYGCISRAQVLELQPVGGDETQQVFSMQLQVETKSGCDKDFVQWATGGALNARYVVLNRPLPQVPWLISCFNTKPDCQFSDSP